MELHQLEEGVVVGCNGDSFFLAVSASGRYIRLPNQTERPDDHDIDSWLATLEPHILAELSERRYIRKGSRIEVQNSHTANLGLVELLLSGQWSGHEKTPLFIDCADAVLCFPNGVEAEHLKDLVRLVASGARPLPRRVALSRSILSESRLIWGERCPQSLRTAALEAMNRDEPSLITSDAINKLGVPGTRSHPAQAIETYRVHLGPEVELWIAKAEVAGANLALPESDYGRLAWGCHPTEDGARLRAASEAVERFASGNIRKQDLLLASMASLDGRAIDPRSITGHSDAQIMRHPNLRKFSETDERYWVQGRMSDGERVWVLADLIYYPFSAAGGVHSQASSSGVAAGPTIDFADSNALREVCERDAVMRWWYGFTKPRRIDDAFSSQFSRSVRELFNRRNIDIRVFDISSEIAAVVMAVATGDDFTVLTASCGAPIAAIQRSLEEAVVFLTSGERIGQADRPQLMRPEQVRTPLDHVNYYANPIHQNSLKDRLQDTEVCAVHQCLDLIPDSHNFPAVFVDLHTTSASSLHVSRCIVPGMIPLTFGWDADPIGLEELSSLCGYDPLAPHPFG